MASDPSWIYSKFELNYKLFPKQGEHKQPFVANTACLPIYYRYIAAATMKPSVLHHHALQHNLVNVSK
ncbi:hypothetical protein V2G26_016119 [Clonostachys chloroleuca]